MAGVSKEYSLFLIHGMHPLTPVSASLPSAHDFVEGI